MGGYDSGVYGTLLYDAQEFTEALVIQDASIKESSLVISDSTSVSENKFSKISKSFSDIVNLVDSMTSSRIATVALSEALVLVDSINLLRLKTFEEAVNLVDNVSKKISMAFEENLVIQESLSASLAGQQFDSITLVETIVKKLSRTLEDSLVLAQEQSNDLLKSFGEEVILQETIVKVLGRNISEALILNEDLNVVLGKTLSDVISIAGEQTNKLFVILTDSVSYVDNISSEQKEFLSNMQTDFASILADVPFEEQVTWKRISKVEDEMGHVSSSTNSTVELLLIIQPITEKDRDLLGSGISVTSHMKAYARHSYRINGVLVEIQTGDHITRRNGDEYLVDQIIGKYAGDSTEVFRKLILRAIDNES